RPHPDARKHRLPELHQQPALRGRDRPDPRGDHGDLPDAGAPHRGVGQPMRNSRRARWTFGAMMAFGLAFVYVPLGVIVINSFNASTVFAWPPKELTTKWWSETAGNPSIRAAVLTSVEIALVATAVALLLGTLLA